MGNHSSQIGGYGKFWILLIVTVLVNNRILKPPFMMEVYFGTNLLIIYLLY